MIAEPTAVTADWRESCKIHIRGIDDDHFILLSLVSELQVAVIEHRGKAVIGQVLSNLISYVKLHFSREERLLQHHGYPDLEQHRAMHDRFARKVLEYQDDFLQGHGEVTSEILAFLRNWIVSHIMDVDKKYAAWLQERGVS